MQKVFPVAFDFYCGCLFQEAVFPASGYSLTAGNIIAKKRGSLDPKILIDSIFKKIVET